MLKHPFLRMCSMLLCAALLLFIPKGANAVTEQATTSDLSKYFWLFNMSEKSDDVISRQTGSWDRTDGNGDSYMAMGYNSESTGVTLLEAEGPGVITRIWCGGHVPIRFYFYIDGAEKPVVNMTIDEMVSGDYYPFVKPLVGDMDDSSGAYYSYVPIPFAESIKIVADCPGYVQINYQKYPADSDVVSFTGQENVDNLVQIMQSIGENPTGNGGTEYTVSDSLSVGDSLTLFDSGRGGAINEIKLNIPQLTDNTATDTTRREYTEYSQFTMAIDPDNDGVALKKLIDISGSGNHTMSVEVDGQTVGDWNCNIQDMEYMKDFGQIERFYIPPKYTQGKSSIRVTMRVTNMMSVMSANEYYIEAYSLVDEIYTLTDRIDVGNAGEESAHDYRVGGDKGTVEQSVTINTLYDVEQYTYAPVTEDGRTNKGTSQFTAKIDSANEGVRVVKLINRYNKGQKTKVTMDGVLVGMMTPPSSLTSRDNIAFPHPTGINNAPFYEIILNLNAKQTQGKDSIDLTFEYVSGNNGVDEYVYRIYSKVNDQWILTDTLDIGNEADEAAHGYQVTEQTWSGANTFHFYVADQWVTTPSVTEKILDQLYIKVTCDDLAEPTIYAPVGAFFGVGQTGLDQNSMLMFGLDDEGVLYSYFQQPYQSNCKVELVNNTELDLTQVTSSILVDHSFVFTDLTGYLKGQYHDQTAERNTDYAHSIIKDYFTYLDTEGSGHLVAIVNTDIGSHDSERDYVETDECFYVDGRKDFSGNGTGKEDMYNGSLCFEKGTFACFPHSYSYHDFSNDGSGALDRMVMVRTYLSDRISFRDGMQFFMESYYAGERQKTLALYYHRDESAMSLTDTLNAADEKSLSAHDYQATDSESFSDSNPWPAYYYEKAGETLNGLSVSSSRFTVSIDPDNAGVVLYRKFSHTNRPSNEDRAVLSVNGTTIGIWTSEKVSAGSNLLNRLGDEAIIIPESLTAGKESLTITLETVDGSRWHDSSYEVYSLRKAKYTCGDVNFDGAINASDALQCLQDSVELIELGTLPRKAADTNLDGVVNASDALAILQYSVGLIKELPIS